jgi:hypothetical protein
MFNHCGRPLQEKFVKNFGIMHMTDNCVFDPQISQIHADFFLLSAKSAKSADKKMPRLL